MNPTAIESVVRVFVWQWMLIIAMAWFFGRVAQRLGQPRVVGEIASGLLLGPSGFGALWPAGFAQVFPLTAQPFLQLLGKIGLILLLFQVGLECDFGHLRNRTRTVTAVSLTGMVFPMLAGWLIGPWLHQRFATHIPYLGFQLFVCIALSITALPVMGRILLELNLERTAIGAIGISAAAIDDVIGWILLATITTLVAASFQWSLMLLQTMGVVALFVLLKHLVGPWLGSRWRQAVGADPASPLSGSFFTLVLLVLLACALMTNLLGVFSIFGAFLLGAALHAERELAKAWRDKMADFVLIALVPIFFTNTGLRTEVGSLASPIAWLGCGVIFVASVASKLGGCFLGGVVSGQSSRDAACVAALMNTRALMGLVAINVGADLGLLPREVFTMFVLMALGTTAMTVPLLRRWLPAALMDKVAYWGFPLHPKNA